MNLKPQSQASLASEIESRLDSIGVSGAAASSLNTFARLLLAGHARDAEQLLGETALADVVTNAFAFLADRPEPGPKLGLHDTTDARDPSRRFSALFVLNDDMPFLVDSVMAEINARGLGVQLVLHPILGAHRDESGMLRAIEARRDVSREDVQQESFILVLLDALGDEPRADLTGALGEVLGEVQAAVSDWPDMIARLDEAIVSLERNAAGVPDDLNSETIAFCRWLRDGEFTFLGMRDYRLVGDPESADLEVIPDTGLGVLRSPNALVLRRGNDRVHMTPEVRRFFFAPQPIIITKSNAVSRVHRRVHMDYIGLKTYAEDGSLTGELRIVGLFTSKAYTEPPQQIPFLRLKVDRVVSEAGFLPASHDGKALLHVLETFPRDELFQIGIRQLHDWSRQILDLEVRPRTLVLARADRFDRFVSLLVYIPRDRFSTSVRERIGQAFAEAYEGRVSAFTPSFTAGPLVRVHYIIGRSAAGPAPAVSQADLEAMVSRAVRTWDDELADELARAPATGLLRPKYRNAFSAGYAEMFPVSRALEDIGRIERLGPDRPVAIDFYSEAGAGPSFARAAIYRFDHPIPLSERVPVLENLGFRVIDERSYRVHPMGPGGRGLVALHDMVLEDAHGVPIDLDAHGERLEEAFLAVFRGEAENDPFNRLVLAAGADWREAAVVRAYAAYLRQIRSPFSPRYIAETLERHGGLAANLIELFRTRFDPSLSDAERQSRGETQRQRFESALDKVASLDEDRILRQMLGAILATVRTSFFCETQAQGLLPVAFKIASRELDGVPAPRPFREIWVYSPRVEGIHLRFAPIARGGLRWSDRPQDFRTEVLGLAKAQQVKNSVIVPAGAKGGFVPKRLPRGGSREEVQAEGEAAYRLFVSSLLDVTDNLVDGRIVPPDRVVRHDGDDPYLVVAADKGTATFSNLANSIADEHHFWLGDAFASGGSAGYDHKKMGITARGAWECVKRHFREMDRDIDAEPFSVVGVGDMSGDVFGNGMLLSPHTRLIAAFDHRDIFIDPDPDPAHSFAERERLFALPRSSWQSYDKAKISKGGGVYSRSAKSIPLSEEARAALGITAATLTPSDLIRAILSAPVDLLWFGGIGTYVRATAETDEQVGDRANDGLRVAASELRASVIGEGANLAVTQRGRIEFAQRGGRLNTDFIDNSAGVNSSDQEVNIKIALQPALVSGRLDMEARNRLLTEMTDDVAGACLENNYRQSLALTVAQRGGAAEIDAFAFLIRHLEAQGLIDRNLDALPDAAELAARKAAGTGLTRPELAVLLSSAKIDLDRSLLETDVPGLDVLRDVLVGYFPAAMRDEFEADILAHPLRREITATGLTNEIVNRCGPAFVANLKELTGCSTTDAAVAFIAASRSFDFPRLWSEINALDNKLPSRVQMGLYAVAQSALRAHTYWLVKGGLAQEGLSEAIARYSAAWSRLANAMPDVLTPPRAEQWKAGVLALGDDAVPPALARALASLEALGESADIAAVMRELGVEDPDLPARAFFELSDRLGLSALRNGARGLHVSDHFDRMAIEDAVATISAGQRKLTCDLLKAEAPSEVPTLDGWLETKGAAATDARHRLAEITAQGELTVSRLTVAAKLVRKLANLERAV